MNDATPFRICNGVLLDRNWKPFPLHPTRTRLPNSSVETTDFIRQCLRDNINFIHLEINETPLTRPNGALIEDAPDLKILDQFLHETLEHGIYLAVTPVTQKVLTPDGRSEHSIREDEPIFAERYCDALFSHVNPLDGRAFYEYDNLAALELIPCPEAFTLLRLSTYIHHMRAFSHHYFLNRLLDVWFSDRGVATPEKLELMQNYGGIQAINLFPDSHKLRFASKLDGIRPAVFSSRVKQHDELLYLSCPVCEAASQKREGAPTCCNGGAEGWITLEADEPVDIQLVFPCPVEEAVYRPSMRNPVTLNIDDKIISFTIEQPRYGVVEVNYHSRTLPHFTAYVFVDPIIPEPPDAVWIEPGMHDHIDYAAAKTIAFKPGLHRLPKDRLTPISNHDIYLAPGAVLQAGLTCEDAENLTIYGTGIFDGTRVKRQPGENWKGRADDAFIHFFKGKHITWDGPTLFNSPFWNLVPEGTHDMLITHHKALTWAVNSDGIQPRSCVNLTVEKSFFKCADDAIAIKTRRESGMYSHDIVVRDIVTWNDAGSALEIGHTSQADLLENVTFQNIEIIHGLVSGLCHMYLIDHSTVRHVLYENIYIESDHGTIPEIAFFISQNFYSTDDERGRIQHITIRNLHVTNAFNGALLQGFDGQHRIEDVTLQNVIVHFPDGHVEPYTKPINYEKICFADEIKLI